jgi:hypothetical protein
MANPTHILRYLHIEKENEDKEINVQNLQTTSKYRFEKEDGTPYIIQKMPGKPQCEFCLNVFSTYSELYKHNAKPCYLSLPLSPHNIRIYFPRSRHFFISDAVHSLGFVITEHENDEFSFLVNENEVQITLLRLYLSAVTKYNLNQYYDALYSHNATPKSVFYPLSTSQLILLKSLSSVALATAMGMSARLTNAELKAREELEDELDLFLTQHFPDILTNPVFVKFTTRSPKDAIATRIDESKTIEEAILIKTNALRVHNAYETLELLSKSKRIFSDINFYFQFGEKCASADLALVFREFRESFRPDFEFRCYVADGKRMTAISQYNCYDVFSSLQDSHVVDRICQAIITKHNIIRNEIPLPSYVIDFAAYKKEGSEDFQVEVIELNPFGSDLSSGSCLFHWEKDSDLLMGKFDTPIEVRIRK